MYAVSASASPTERSAGGAGIGRLVAATVRPSRVSSAIGQSNVAPEPGGPSRSPTRRSSLACGSRPRLALSPAGSRSVGVLLLHRAGHPDHAVHLGVAGRAPPPPHQGRPPPLSPP